MSDVIGWQDVYVNGSLIGSYPMYQRGRYIEVDMHAAGVIPAGSMVTFDPLAATPPQPSAGLRAAAQAMLDAEERVRAAASGDSLRNLTSATRLAEAIKAVRAALAAKPDAGEVTGTIYNVIGGNRLTITIEVDAGLMTTEEAWQRFPTGTRAVLRATTDETGGGK